MYIDGKELGKQTERQLVAVFYITVFIVIFIP